MRTILFAAAFAVGLCAASAAPAATRNYDCSKPNNANKTVCKTAAKLAKPAPAKAAAAKPTASKVSGTTTTRLVTVRKYDCSKAGNKNKAECKTAATASAPIVKATTVATTTKHYDCSKAGNTNKQACKVSISTKQVAARPVAQPRHAAAARRPAAKASEATDNNIAAGAIAQCKDGKYSHSKTRTGACSTHGGVARWS